MCFSSTAEHPGHMQTRGESQASIHVRSTHDHSCSRRRGGARIRIGRATLKGDASRDDIGIGRRGVEIAAVSGGTFCRSGGHGGNEERGVGIETGI